MAYFTKPLRNVSIHALLAECDLKLEYRIFLSLVSIHALLAECDGTRKA